MTEISDVTTGLRFPEGPVACPDGSIILVEIEAGRLTRVASDGSKTVVAETGGGPNGAAFGPDGRLYVCNNGGMTFHERGGSILPGLSEEGAPTGWIEAVDVETGAVEVLYRECDGIALLAPNDIVFDSDGGMWFTDHGKTRRYSRDRGAVYYATCDGSTITRVVGPMEAPNGIGLSPDGSRLYVADTPTGRLWVFDIDGPGKVKRMASPAPWERGALLANPPGYNLFDSLAVDADGNVCIATIPGGLTVVSPDGQTVRRIEMPDLMPTNICFDVTGKDVAYVTLSAAGRLVAMPWECAGANLAFC